MLMAHYKNYLIAFPASILFNDENLFLCKNVISTVPVNNFKNLLHAIIALKPLTTVLFPIKIATSRC